MIPTRREDIEIMAPVGSFESLRAAIQGKADAVYFGIGNLNMRSKSSLNFTTDDLAEIVKICREHHLKSYVTLNTVMYDEDLIEMRQTVDACKKHQVDAIIASDIAAIRYAREQGVEVHISTQINISNTEAVRNYSQYADVMVLSRELNLNQIKTIHNNIIAENIKGPAGELVKLELFVHGALCMAVSGKCYLSLHEYNRSANRGECFQLCRRAYVVTDKETNTQLEVDNEYIMSPKDLCTIQIIDRIIKSGVSVFKIEGRARSAEYVKTVADCYNQAVDAYFNNTYTEELRQTLLDKLSTVYNRGFWEGYYLGQKMGEWSTIYGSKATKKKIYIGKSLNYFSNLKVGEFVVETGELAKGDEILITGPTTGVLEMNVDEIRVNLVAVDKAVKGEKFSMPVGEIVRRSDKLYKLVPNEDL